MRKIIVIAVLFFCLSSCKKKEIKNESDTFFVTFDGASFTCTGPKALIDIKDVSRLNVLLNDGIANTYEGTAVGLIDLKGSYEKNDKIKVYVTRYKKRTDQVCPAFSPFPSVFVIKEERVN